MARPTAHVARSNGQAIVSQTVAVMNAGSARHMQGCFSTKTIINPCHSYA